MMRADKEFIATTPLTYKDSITPFPASRIFSFFLEFVQGSEKRATLNSKTETLLIAVKTVDLRKRT